MAWADGQGKLGFNSILKASQFEPSKLFGVPLTQIAHHLGVDDVQVWQVESSHEVGVRLIKGTTYVTRMFAPESWYYMTSGYGNDQSALGYELKKMAVELLKEVSKYGDPYASQYVSSSEPLMWWDNSSSVSEPLTYESMSQWLKAQQSSFKPWSDPASDPLGDLQAAKEALFAQAGGVKGAVSKWVDPVRWPHPDELSAVGLVVVGEWVVRHAQKGGDFLLHAPLVPDDAAWLKAMLGGLAYARVACSSGSATPSMWKRPGVVAKREWKRCHECSWATGLHAGGTGSPVHDKVAAEMLGLAFEPVVKGLSVGETAEALGKQVQQAAVSVGKAAGKVSSQVALIKELIAQGVLTMSEPTLVESGNPQAGMTIKFEYKDEASKASMHIDPALYASGGTLKGSIPPGVYGITGV